MLAVFLRGELTINSLSGRGLANRCQLKPRLCRFSLLPVLFTQSLLIRRGLPFGTLSPEFSCSLSERKRHCFTALLCTGEASGQAKNLQTEDFTVCQAASFFLEGVWNP